jgi:molybdopterin/thiamine biosynthesis adenylyltransferase
MKFHFYVVGCGGTGSLLARDLPKLLVGRDDKITLIDGDTVEQKNIARQTYQMQDVAENKANALSRKINTLYDTTTFAMDVYLTKDELLQKIVNHTYHEVAVIIGCVDNDNTRKILEATFHKLKDVIYIDSANGAYEGNVYVAVKTNGKTKGLLRSDSYKLENDVHPLDESCQTQVAKGNVQYLVTNAKMAVSILEICNSLLENNMKVGVQSVKRFESVFYD